MTTSSFCRRTGTRRLAHAVAALIVYTQGLMSIVFALYMTPVGCQGAVEDCPGAHRRYCGFRCPTLAVFMILIFSQILASLYGLLRGIAFETSRARVEGFAADRKVALRAYGATGAVVVATQAVFVVWPCAVVTCCLYIIALGLTREWQCGDEPAQEMMVV